MKVYVVCWGSAGQDEDNGCNSTAYCGVHNIYTLLDDAKKGLEEYKNLCYDEIVNDPDYDEESKEFAAVNTSVYGSVEEEYFEIDYFIGDTSCELHIRIVEKEIAE